MFFLYIFLLFSSCVYATSPSEEETQASPQKISLLDRKDFLGNKNLQTEGVLNLRHLEKLPKGKILFSGREVDPEHERKSLGHDKRQDIGGTCSWYHPGACIASLEICFEHFTNFGTGFLISPSCIMTATDNLGDADEITSIMCYFGRYRSRVKDFTEVKGFTRHTSLKEGEKSHYCLLLLQRPMGRKVGHLKPTLSGLENHWISLQGYPGYYYGDGKIELVNGACQYQSYSKDVSIQGDFLYYSLQATAGQSGSPIFRKTRSIYPRFMGMHLSGAEDINKEERYPYKGLYLTPQLLQELDFLVHFLEAFQNNPKSRVKVFDINETISLHLLRSFKKEESSSSLSSDESSEEEILSKDKNNSLEEKNDPEVLETGKKSYESLFDYCSLL